MAENFFSNPNPAPQSTGFMTPAAPAQVAPTGNPFVNQGAPVNGYGANPQMGAATAAMIYQRMGYWDGNPTEIDIFSDIIRAASPMGRFLASEQGFPALAQFFSTLIDYKLVSFFKEYKLGMVQDENGQMFLQPLAEQPSERGKELHTMTMAEVSTTMSAISEQLKSTLLAQADELLSNHRQAAQMRAAQQGLDGIIADAVDGNGGRGGALSSIISGVTNTAMRSVGIPVPPAATGPPPPPGRNF